MSYILDALRRADAERERGAVPGLHAQPFPPGPGERAAPGGRAPWHLVALGGAAGLALPLAGWLLFGGDAPHATPPPAPLTAASPPTPTPTPAPPPPAAEPPAQASPVPPPAAPPTRRAETRVAPAPERAPTASAAPRRAAKADAADHDDAPTAPARTSRSGAAERQAARAPATSTVAPAAEPPASAAAADPARLPTLAELPEALRRQLPALQIGGSMYSEAPANRMLIVNGQLLHEGSTVVPGLVLEQIRLKSAVFSFQGQRYEMRY